MIHNCLFNNQFNRSDCIVCIGGGLLGDMVGFSASTYKRGIEFINVPTTVLAMVDSSIGSKTGINNQNGKNMIGAFYDPFLIINCIDFINTLTIRDIRNGFSEIIKISVVFDKTLFDILDSNSLTEIISNRELLLDIIKRSQLIKI